METVYRYLLGFEFKQAIKVARLLFNPNSKGMGFFLNYNDTELLSVIKKIRVSKSLEGAGFTNDEITKINTIMCLFFCVPTFDYKERMKEAIPGLESRLRAFSKIKKKDLPFMDLKNLLKGDKVVKSKKT